MITTGESTDFEPFVTMDDSNTDGGGLSYVADQPFLVRTNTTSNYFDPASGSWINHQSEILDSRKHFSVVNLFDNVYVFGGENEFAVDTADCLQFNGFKFIYFMLFILFFQCILSFESYIMVNRV